VRKERRLDSADSSRWLDVRGTHSGLDESCPEELRSESIS
jgi:hypothetical protein